MAHERYGLEFVGKRDARALLDRVAGGALEPRGDLGDGAHVLVEGDNLEVMKLLRPAYCGRVDMIYIDPPYNTGKDFVYRDDYHEPLASYLARSGQADVEGRLLVANPETTGRYHSSWLAMMYPRLVLAHELLRDEGLMFVSIDDHEVHNLRLIMNEVFGEDQFIAQITLVSNRGGRDYLPIAVTHEYLLCYGRSEDARVRELAKDGDALPSADDRGRYALRELRNRNPRFHPGNRPNLFYAIHVDPTRRTDAGECAVSLDPAPGHDVVVEPRNSRGHGSVWRWGRERTSNAVVAGDPVASDVVARQRPDGGWNVYEKHRKSTTKARSVWNDKHMRSEQGTREVRELFDGHVFDHPKPVELIQRCLELGMGDDGLVLDFFAGSGTTTHAVMELNARDGGSRRSLLIQLPEPTPDGSGARQAGYETIADLAAERIARAAARLSGQPARLRRFALVAPRLRRRAAERMADVSALLAALACDPWPTDVPAATVLWELLVASGFGLDAHVTPVDGSEASWRVADPGAGRVGVVCLRSALRRELVDALDVPRGGLLLCRDGALDDELAVNLSRRFNLVAI